MATRLYDGSNWKNINGLKLFDGSSWKNAVRGWMWNGSAWKQWYPEYPINTSAPTVSGSTTQGNTLSCTTGSWNSNLAYNPTTYAYQWRRGSTDISGATSSTYVTQVADVGNAVSCRVTGTNNRGSTPVVSSNSITIQSAIPGAPTNLTLGDVTLTPPMPSSVSTSSSTTSTASASWSAPAAGNPWQTYTLIITSPYSISWNGDINNRNASISGGSAGASYIVYVGSVNNYGRWTASWNAGSNATSYDIYENGVYLGNTTNTSFTYQSTFTGSRTVNVRSRNNAGAESTGVSGSVTCNQQVNYNSASGSFYAVYPSISGTTYSSLTHNSVTISWSSTNQSSYSISGLPGGTVTGTTQTSRSFSGLSASTSYTATVTVTSSTGNSASQSTSFTTSIQPVIPSINSFVLQAENPSTGTSIDGSTTQSIYAVWSSTNQSSYSLTISPATGGSGGGSSWSGSTATSRYLSLGDRGTTYTATLTITSSTGNTATSTASRTPPSSGTAPSTPTNGGGTFATGTNYVTNATFTSSSSGTTPITYSWIVYSSTSSSGPWSYRNGGSIQSSQLSTTLSIPQQSWNQSSFGAWAQYNVAANNNIGSSPGSLTWVL